MQTRDDGRLQTVTVGVDVGSSTTQLAVCESLAEMDGTRFRVVARRVRHQSEVILTPYTSAAEIAADELAEFVDQELGKALLDPDGIDSGAVLLTGTALQKQNSRLVGDMLGALSHRFLSVGAGDVLETVLSAHGSGARATSAADGRSYLLCDIGGGTTKLALCVDGEIRGISALDVGARLVAWGEDRVVFRVEPAAQRLAGQLGFTVELGAVLEHAQERALARRMSEVVLAAAGLRQPSAADLELFRVRELPTELEFDAVVFAGGVAEFLYGRESRDFGDLGPALASCLRANLAATVLDLGASIRSTVLGVAQASYELSGNTIFVHAETVLPLRNMPVVAPAFDLAPVVDASAVAEQTRAALAADGRDLSAGVAVGFSWDGSATVDRLTGFGSGLLAGIGGVLLDEAPLVLMCQDDVGALVGRFMSEVLGAGRPLVSVDGLSLQRFDFVDVSEFLGTSGAVTVHVKSLLFPEGRRG